MGKNHHIDDGLMLLIPKSSSYCDDGVASSIFRFTVVQRFAIHFVNDLRSGFRPLNVLLIIVSDPLAQTIHFSCNLMMCIYILCNENYICAAEDHQPYNMWFTLTLIWRAFSAFHFALATFFFLPFSASLLNRERVTENEGMSKIYYTWLKEYYRYFVCGGYKS